MFHLTVPVAMRATQTIELIDTLPISLASDEINGYPDSGYIMRYLTLLLFCSTDTAALRATQVVDLVGIGLIGLALILNILKMTVMKHQPDITTRLGLLMISAGLLIHHTFG